MEAALAKPQATGSLRVESEVGILRRVMLHRPGRELQRLTPSNAAALLFDDIPWAKRARQEHDAFADTLRERDVEVLDFGQLLRETLADPVSRAWVLDRVVDERAFGPALADALSRYLSDLPADELGDALIAGILRSELPFAVPSLVYETLGPRDFVLPALPNHLFARDTSCWIAHGVCINPMARPARRRESIHVEAVYRFHPRFVGHAFPVWYGGDGHEQQPATLEGGDVLVVGNGVVVIGMGERTAPQTVELLARRLFAADVAQRIIAVALPKERRTMHLDTMLTMVDRDLFLAYPGIASHLPRLDSRAWHRRWRYSPPGHAGSRSLRGHCARPAA